MTRPHSNGSDRPETRTTALSTGIRRMGSSGLTRDVADGVHRIEDAYVNWYIVEDAGRLTVVDAGLPASWGSLLAAVTAIGHALEDIDALVLTHAHFDHVGFAERARRELGIPVWVPAGDERLARHPFRYRRPRSPLRYAARFPGARRTLTAMTLHGVLATRGIRQARTYRPGDTLPVPGSPLAIATPGHTDGHVVLLLADRDTVIAGDALVMRDPYTGMVGPRLVALAATADGEQADRSLDAVAATGVRTVLTGHGAPWTWGAEEMAARARVAGIR